jgi:hypothetical protein
MSVVKGRKGFQKGVVTNPTGRKKGAYSPLRRKLMELRELASEKVQEAFNDLWRDFKAGDPLAKQIYFKELVSAPKEWLNEINTTDIPKELNNAEDLTKCMLAVAEKLANVDTMSNDEAHNLVKTLNSIKMSEAIDQISTIIESRESLMEKVDKIQRVIDYVESQKKAENM